APPIIIPGGGWCMFIISGFGCCCMEVGGGCCCISGCAPMRTVGRVVSGGWPSWLGPGMISLGSGTVDAFFFARNASSCAAISFFVLSSAAIAGKRTSWFSAFARSSFLRAISASAAFSIASFRSRSLSAVIAAAFSITMASRFLRSSSRSFSCKQSIIASYGYCKLTPTHDTRLQ
ncbi:hypothetical protein PFISCL1PPCAC_8446, partial [Pristionchus fissidentatus]